MATRFLPTFPRRRPANEDSEPSASFDGFAVWRISTPPDTARREVEHLANWDFDRLIMAHGEVIETGGKSALLEAFGWAGVSEN
ncbi:MAG: hypothetical protein ACQEVA_12915 [Myxococcota bacterium]